MANTALVIDVLELFQQTFGKRPHVTLNNPANEEGTPYQLGITANRAETEQTTKGSLIKERYKGVEIFLPVRLYDGDVLTYLPYCVIKVSGKKTIVETPLSERTGSVKEQFNIDDYSIDIKGFMIGEDRKFPETDIEKLRTLYETKRAVRIENALTNIFLNNPGASSLEQCRVVVYSFDMPEQQGGREHIRPFTMSLKSDTVFTLELDA
ncbi:MAG: DUF6046 domain-containing protein [Bacteroidota bacterium]